jgi:DNA mismatch repair protein MutL
MSQTRPVRTLNPEVARKIAAGEVIDRPNAIIRELMDNSIDAGASSITVEITGGGIDKIRIIDDGSGMTEDDLKNCARPHATSKIESEVDLMNLSTLGFRGEALASIAAVARLSIISGGWKMNASITEDHILTPTAQIQGTIVQSEGLFENFPARRQFLKRAATEGIMCKNTFIEKAMARPDIGFRFICDGETKLDLPKNQSVKERFLAANSYREEAALFYEFSSRSASCYTENRPEWSFTVVIGEPAVSRTNKKDIFIYTNGRKIQEYSLVQAVEYGGQGFFPNGTFPVAAVFIEINPESVDFNIHPAKKEARFSDISDLHHGLSSTIRSFFQTYTRSNFEQNRSTDDINTDIVELDFNDMQTVAPAQTTAQTSTQTPAITKTTIQVEPQTSKAQNPSQNLYTGSRHIEYKQTLTPSMSMSDFRSKYLTGRTSTPSVEKLAEEALQEAAPEKSPAPVNIRPSNIRFIGSALGTFLIAEKDNCLFIIDQHAAHERILFDKIMASQGKRQPLLIPYKIKTESKSQDKQLEKIQERLTQIGFTTEKKEDGYWEITTVPERWTSTEYDLRNLIFVKNVEPEQIIRSIAAMTACHAAVKDGYILDDDTAAKLVEQAFQLEDPHCPHGRPIYTVISRQKLFELVKRT